MRKTPLTPAEIEAGNFSPLTKKKYLNQYNANVRMKSIRQQARECQQFIRDNAHLPIQELADKLGITKRSVSNIASKHGIVLSENWRAKIVRENVKQLVERISLERESRPAPVVKEKSVKVKPAKPPKVKKEELPKPPKVKKEKPVKVKVEKIKPVRVKKERDRQVVERAKIIQQKSLKVAKIKKKTLAPVVRDFTAMKLVHLGIKNISFYVPADATQKQIESEKEKRMLKYKSA